MTGLLLAGVEPLTAVLVQLAVMYLILGSVAIAVVVVVSSSRRGRSRRTCGSRRGAGRETATRRKCASSSTTVQVTRPRHDLM